MFTKLLISLFVCLKQQKEMSDPQKYLVHVYVDTDVAMTLSLSVRPQSVEELKVIMQERFKPSLDGDFSLQYEDLWTWTLMASLVFLWT